MRPLASVSATLSPVAAFAESRTQRLLCRVPTGAVVLGYRLPDDPPPSSADARHTARDLPNHDPRPGAPSRDPQGVMAAAQVAEVAAPELQPAVLRARDPVGDRVPASQKPPVNPRR